MKNLMERVKEIVNEYGAATFCTSYKWYAARKRKIDEGKIPMAVIRYSQAFETGDLVNALEENGYNIEYITKEKDFFYVTK